MSIQPLARLHFTLPSKNADKFHHGYTTYIAPILTKHGIVPDSDPPPFRQHDGQHCFNILFPAQSPNALDALKKDLYADPDWQAALATLKECIHNHYMALHRTPVGPGHTVAAGSATPTRAGAGSIARIGPGFAQGLWHNYGLIDGVPPNISAILQHPSGDLFMGTREYASNLGRGHGLWRYDGSNLHQWTTADGLPSDQVVCLCLDKENYLWIGSQGGGLTRYDGQTFTTYTTQNGLPDSTVSALCCDLQGHLWVGTEKGLCRYNGDTFKTFGAADGLSTPRIARILQDRQGRLWLGGGWSTQSPSGLGLSCYDGDTFTCYTTAEGLPSNWVLSLLEDPKGTLWIGQNNGASRLDGGRFTPAFDTDTIQHLGGVSAMALDQNGQVYFSVWGEGLRCYDGTDYKTLPVHNGLPSNAILSLLNDRDDQLWAGTLNSGLSRHNGRLEQWGAEKGLPHPAVQSLAADGQGTLWIGTNRGLSRCDGDAITAIEAIEEELATSLLRDSKGHIWFARPGEGMSRWDGHNSRCFPIDDALEPSARDRITPLLEDAAGNLYFVEISKQGRLLQWNNNQLIPFVPDLGFAPHSVRAMLQDQQGRLWFGGQGLCYVDTDKTRRFGIADGLVAADEIHVLIEDIQGRIWIGTNNGLLRWDNSVLTRFDTTTGLNHNQVQALMQDARGHLWIGTTGGVCRFDGQVFQYLARRDGLPDDSVYALTQEPPAQTLLNPGDSATNRDVQETDRLPSVWIGTLNGLLHYRPTQYPPTLRFKGLVADRQYSPDEPIAVPSSQRLVSIEFQGHSMTTPATSLAYVCRLQGRDTAWQTVRLPRVEYADLPEGDYVFEVRVVDRDLNYSATASLRFSVEPDVRLQSLAAALAQSGPQGVFVGDSPALEKVQHQLRLIAPADTTVLVLGETGTGKGLAARTLHRLSPRRDHPFVVFTCGGQPDSLLESELFGHEKGAFTGAVARRLGKVELAKDGTLFLDEIGDLPLTGQVKLLRLLEERTYERVGGNRELRAEIRVVAATNRDLRQQIAEGTFRQDLFFRLQGFEIRLPPMRQRKADIPLLALYFIGPKAAHLDKKVTALSPAAEAALIAYDWPGNVRELQHAIETAVVVCRGDTIQDTDLSLGYSAPTTTSLAAPTSDFTTLDEHERQYIHQVLESTGWTVAGPQGAATILGLKEATLRFRMRKLGIKRPK